MSRRKEERKKGNKQIDDAFGPAIIASFRLATSCWRIVCFLPLFHKPADLGEFDKPDCMSTFPKLGVLPHMQNQLPAFLDR